MINGEGVGKRSIAAWMLERRHGFSRDGIGDLGLKGPPGRMTEADIPDLATPEGRAEAIESLAELPPSMLRAALEIAESRRVVWGVAAIAVARSPSGGPDRCATGRRGLAIVLDSQVRCNMQGYPLAPYGSRTPCKAPWDGLAQGVSFSICLSRERDGRRLAVLPRPKAVGRNGLLACSSLTFFELPGRQKVESECHVVVDPGRERLTANRSGVVEAASGSGGSPSDPIGQRKTGHHAASGMERKVEAKNRADRPPFTLDGPVELHFTITQFPSQPYESQSA